MTVINPKRIANDPRLGWRDKMQAIAFAYFLSFPEDAVGRPLVPDLHMLDWALGKTAFCNITAWTLPA